MFYDKEKEDHRLDKGSPSSPMFSNSIDLLLNKKAFYDDEEVIGHAIINIRETFSVRRLTLSIVGEMVSHTQAPAKKGTLKKMPTMAHTLGASGIVRTFTATKEANTEATPFKKTLTRTFTMTTTKSTAYGSGKILPIDEMKNRELFCHYIVPVFTFKTSELPTGIYKIPFKFMLSSGVLPSVDYNRDKVQFAVTYTAIAELEELSDNEDNGRNPGFYIGNNNLKCKKELKIYHSSTRKQDRPPILDFSKTEVTGRLKLPEIFCFRPNEAKVKLRLEGNSFNIGDSVKFELESNHKSLNSKKTKITLNLIEELNKMGSQLDAFKVAVDPSGLKFDVDNETGALNKVKISGSVTLNETLKKSLRSSSDLVEHFFEVLIRYKTGLTHQTISLRVPIILGQAGMETPKNNPDPAHSEKSIHMGDEDEEDDDTVVLPLAKFKLEERFNLLTKAVQMLEDN